jgi:gentisate 1,2-dioxygenase
MHRLRAGRRTARTRTTASSVWQVFDGAGTAVIGDQTFTLAHGDVFVVPSWQSFEVTADGDLDLFTFSDAPIFEKLSLLRAETMTA